MAHINIESEVRTATAFNYYFKWNSLSNKPTKLISCIYVLVFSDKECSKYEFNCGNGTCINKTKLCDGIKDCSDNGADEVDCGKLKY